MSINRAYTEKSGSESESGSKMSPEFTVVVGAAAIMECRACLRWPDRRTDGRTDGYEVEN